jgi:hypothetical protein
MDLEMHKEAIFPPSGPYHSQQFYHSHFLWFKIITYTVEIDSDEGKNTRGRKGASTSNHMTRKTSPTYQPAKKTSRKT